MDFNMKQWREHESEEHQQEQAPSSAKIPRLLTLDPPPPSPAPLPLFLTEPTIKTPKIDMSASSSSHSTPTIFPRVGSYFSLAQWQELELQALIFRHMLAGAAIPLELLHLVKKSLINNTNPYYFTTQYPLQHYPHHLHPSYTVMQSAGGYWGKGAMDPEPTRCRRTDGKKWRCSRDVVAGHKYCERHVHRGRNRSRKPVEIPTPPPTSSGTGGGVLFRTTSPSVVAQPVGGGGGGGGASLVGFSGPSPSFDLLRFNNRSTSKVEEGEDNICGGVGKSGGQTLRHFFDDWSSRPPLQESENNAAAAAGGRSASYMASTSTITTTTTTTTGLSVSDFSLKLSTGTVGVVGGNATVSTEGGGGRSRPEESGSGGGGTWGGASNQMASMGGPLAEALRSSTSISSPTSVLHH